MTRQEVYEAIDSERNYQEAMSKNKYRPDIIKDFHLGDALSAIQHNLNKAHETWYKGSDPHTNTMELFRKISALCVAQMEKNGVDKRIE